MLLGKTGSSTSWQKGLLSEEIWNLDRQPPMLLWELMAVKTRTCKEIRSRCYLVAEWPSTMDFKSKGLTFGQYRKGCCLSKGKGGIVQQPQRKCRFSLISGSSNSEWLFNIAVSHARKALILFKPSQRSCPQKLQEHLVHGMHELFLGTD